MRGAYISKGPFVPKEPMAVRSLLLPYWSWSSQWAAGEGLLAKTAPHYPTGPIL